MLWVYRILFLPLLALSSPYYLWRMLRRGGYANGFGQRLGLFPALPPKRPGIRRLWIQAVSVGEIEAIGPLLARLRESGRFEIVLTTTTSTGYRLALERHAAACLAIGVFPIDFWPCSAAAWRRIQPDAIVLTEGELWPEHLLGQARHRDVPAALVNARLSDRSFARHRRTPRIASELLGTFAWIGAGSEEDARRLLALGAKPERVEVTGNLKFDVAAEGALPAAERDARLLLVPRHAERRDAVRRELAEANLAFHQRSTDGARAKPGTVVHLADTTGELRRLTRAADLAFSGKSLPPHDGGQTPVECAAAGVPLVYGPAMTNFRTICGGLESAGAARRGADAADVTESLVSLACDPTARSAMGSAARAWHAANRGASDRTADRLLAQLR